MLQFKCAVTDKCHLTLPILLTMAILSYCSGAGVASAGDVVSESGAAEDIQKAAEIARPGDSIIIPKGKFPFHGQVFLPDGVSVRGAGKNDTLLVKDDRLSEWKPMFSVDCKTGKPFSFSGITIAGCWAGITSVHGLFRSHSRPRPSIKREVQGFSHIWKPLHQVFSRRNRVERG